MKPLNPMHIIMLQKLETFPYKAILLSVYSEQTDTTRVISTSFIFKPLREAM